MIYVKANSSYFSHSFLKCFLQYWWKSVFHKTKNINENFRFVTNIKILLQITKTDILFNSIIMCTAHIVPNNSGTKNSFIVIMDHHHWYIFFFCFQSLSSKFILIQSRNHKQQRRNSSKDSWKKYKKKWKNHTPNSHTNNKMRNKFQIESNLNHHHRNWM